jgi:hypothetical protein
MAPSAEAAQQAVGHYRAYYQRKGMFENHVYPGMKERNVSSLGAGQPNCSVAYKIERIMPLPESVIVPSKSNKIVYSKINKKAEKR